MINWTCVLRHVLWEFIQPGTVIVHFLCVPRLLCSVMNGVRLSGLCSTVTTISIIVILPVVMCYVTWLMIAVRFFITTANSLGP